MAYWGNQNFRPQGYNSQPQNSRIPPTRNPYPPNNPYTPRNPYHPSNPPPGVQNYIWEWFRAVDQDNSGSINCFELQRALMNGNHQPFNQETCRLMIGMFDTNRNGTIDVHEFSSLWDYIQQWKNCFESYDRDKSGNIDVNELHTAFTSFGYRLSRNFCDLIVKKFDRSGRNNAINFDDFIQTCVMLKTLTDGFRKRDTDQSGIIKLHYEQFLELVIDNTIH